LGCVNRIPTFTITLGFGSRSTGWSILHRERAAHRGLDEVGGITFRGSEAEVSVAGREPEVPFL
jgi:hypothetical protein